MPTLARSDCSGPRLRTQDSRSGFSVRVNNVLLAFYMYNYTLIHMPTLARSDCSGPRLRTQDSRSGFSVRVNNVLPAFYMYNYTLIHMPTLARSDCVLDQDSGLKIRFECES